MITQDRARPWFFRWFRFEEDRMLLDADPSIQNYLDSYHRYSKNGQQICISELEVPHQQSKVSLHRGAGSAEVNISAFLYAASRLPDCMHSVDVVIAGADRAVLASAGIADLSGWQVVEASKRRRRSFYDGDKRLAVLLASRSDLDDLVPSLCAYQIEWNKMHRLLAGRSCYQEGSLRLALDLNRSDFAALRSLWGDDWDAKISSVVRAEKNISLKLFSLEEEGFQDQTDQWFHSLFETFADLDLANRPVYLVTSNRHSLANLVTGFAGRFAGDIKEIARKNETMEPSRLFNRLVREGSSSSQNLLYYSLAELIRERAELGDVQYAMEKQAGISHSGALPPLQAEAQIFEVGRFHPERLDSRIKVRNQQKLSQSRAVILNTEYPLGFAAYYLLQSAGRKLSDWRGLYVLGKGAAMIGRLGDILIPTQVRDVHSRKLLSFQNCFNARSLTPYLWDSAVFDDQRSLTVHGTFLHSWNTVRNLHRADFTGIEMEAGPCLSAVYDYFKGDRGEVSPLLNVKTAEGFDLGILHYTSDIPYNLRASLLSQPVGLAGLESTYSCSLAILQRIIDLEEI